MTKLEFILMLHERLNGLPEEDIVERLNFYTEIMDDRMEEGLSEEEAVASVGDVDEIAQQILEETPLTKLVLDKIKPKKRLRAWEIILLVLGFPVWGSLLIAAFAVVLSLYAVCWSVMISLWACEVSLGGCALGGVASGIVLAIYGNTPTGIALIGAGIVCAGLFVFGFFTCKTATKGLLLLTKKITLTIKHCFVKKEAVS